MVSVAEGARAPGGRGASGGNPKPSRSAKGASGSGGYGRGRSASGGASRDRRPGAATGDARRTAPGAAGDGPRQPGRNQAGRNTRTPAGGGTGAQGNQARRGPAVRSGEGTRRTGRPAAGDSSRESGRASAGRASGGGARTSGSPRANVSGSPRASSRAAAEGGSRGTARAASADEPRRPARPAGGSDFRRGSRAAGGDFRAASRTAAGGARRPASGDGGPASRRDREGDYRRDREGDRRRDREGDHRRDREGDHRRDREGAPARTPRGRGGSFSRDGDRDRLGGSAAGRSAAERGAAERTAGRGGGRWQDRPGGGRPRAARDEAPARGPRAADEARPQVPDSIQAQQLDPEARAQLHSLPNDLADSVARYLVAAGLAEDPEQGYAYAQAAKRLAARVGVVREAVGIAAYQTGRWAEALSELRAARRMTGRDDYLPVMADSERALGRLDRALALVREASAAELDRATQIELRIVESGIRRDQGLPEAAIVALQVPELTSGRLRPWSARLFYAYADALLAAGRADEARDAFARAAEADAEGETDAAERLDELDGIEFEDLEDSGLLEDSSRSDDRVELPPGFRGVTRHDPATRRHRAMGPPGSRRYGHVIWVTGGGWSSRRNPGRGPAGWPGPRPRYQAPSGSVVLSQCRMPSTLVTAPLIRSNFCAMAESASGLSAA